MRHVDRLPALIGSTVGEHVTAVLREQGTVDAAAMYRGDVGWVRTDAVLAEGDQVRVSFTINMNQLQQFGGE